MKFVHFSGNLHKRPFFSVVTEIQYALQFILYAFFIYGNFVIKLKLKSNEQQKKQDEEFV